MITTALIASSFHLHFRSSYHFRSFWLFKRKQSGNPVVTFTVQCGSNFEFEFVKLSFRRGQLSTAGTTTCPHHWKEIDREFTVFPFQVDETSDYVMLLMSVWVCGLNLKCNYSNERYWACSILVYYAVKGSTVQGQRRQNRVRLFKHKRARFDPFPWITTSTRSRGCFSLPFPYSML